MSETVHHLGPAGSGARIKLVGNLVVASQLEALGESLTLVKDAGSIHAYADSVGAPVPSVSMVRSSLDEAVQRG